MLNFFRTDITNSIIYKYIILSYIKPISHLSKCHFTYNYVTFYFLDPKQTLTDCSRRSNNPTVGSEITICIFKDAQTEKQNLRSLTENIFVARKIQSRIKKVRTISNDPNVLVLIGTLGPPLYSNSIVDGIVVVYSVGWNNKKISQGQDLL